MDKSLEMFPYYGFQLMDHFLLPEKYWWTGYYAPLKERIKELRQKHKGSKELESLKSHEREIALVEKNPKEFDCGYYILQKVR